jgi:FixJ family two-component response regulator
MTHPASVVVAIDDDRRVRDSLQSVLESAGYAAELFASAEAFLSSGAIIRAGCAIVDVRLPGMDGLELQRRIRRERPALPVIVVTAHDDDETRRQAMEGGAVAFMVKPFDAAELLERVEAAMKAG